MSILMDGIQNVNALSGQISDLQSLTGQNLEDPKVLEFALQQNFNKMLEDLIASTNNDDDDEETSDPFSFIIPNQQASLQSLQTQGILDGNDDQAIINSLPDTSSPEYLASLYNLGQL